MNYSLTWLQNQIEKGIQQDFLLFWGHTQKQEEVIDKSCFSQWFPSPFTIDGVTYRTAEHWMMVQKALLFNDHDIAEKVIAAEKPASAKSLGRQVKNFSAETWDRLACSIVVEGNKHKFSQHDRLKEYLLQTGNKTLVEASPTDTIWGIGLPQDAKDATNPFKWRGTNLLGFALMEVRDFLKQQ